MLTQENIDNHFLANRVWKEIFLSKYPNYTPETYIQNAWELFQQNGYYIEFERLSKDPENKKGLYNVVRANLYNKALINTNVDYDEEEYNLDGFVVGTDWIQERDHIQQLVIWCICDFEIDVTTLK